MSRSKKNIKKQEQCAESVEIKTYVHEGGLIQGIMYNPADAEQEARAINEWIIDTQKEQTEIALTKLGWMPPAAILKMSLAMKEAYESAEQVDGSQPALDHIVEAMNVMREAMSKGDE